MSCPRCLKPLIKRRERDVDIEICEGCQGIFLHRGELNRIAEPTTGDLEFSTLDAESFEHADSYPVAACPSCPDRSMKKVEFNIYTGIILDYCEDCGGFWLDGPELAKINDEVKHLDDQSDDDKPPPMLWFAHFIWSLPR